MGLSAVGIIEYFKKFIVDQSPTGFHPSSHDAYVDDDGNYYIDDEGSFYIYVSQAPEYKNRYIDDDGNYYIDDDDDFYTYL